LVLLGLTVATPAYAVQATAIDSRLVVALQELPSNAQVRLNTNAGAVLFGGMEDLRPDSIVLVGAADRFSVPLASVTELSKRQRAWRRGALIGGTVGAAAGLLMGFILPEAVCDAGSDCDVDRWKLAIGFGLGGGLGGAAEGALVGSLFSHWHTVYSAAP
jgi:cyanophycinase-like exopeptidase